MFALAITESSEPPVLIKVIMKLTFRLTGPQTVERLTPLMPLIDPSVSWTLIESVPATASGGDVIDFVWETYVEKVFKAHHDGARVLNRLHNTVVSGELTD